MKLLSVKLKSKIPAHQLPENLYFNVSNAMQQWLRNVANSSLQIWMKIKQMFIYLPDKDVMAQDRFPAPRSSFAYSATLDQKSFDDLWVGWTVWFQEDDAGQGDRGYGGR